MILVESPHVEVLDDIISEADCRSIIEVATPKLQRSMVAGLKITPARTSSDAKVHYHDCQAAASLLDAVAIVAGVKVECIEPISVIRYESGQFYRPHVDYFKHVDNRRIATAVVYLNDVHSGGETIFPQLRKVVKPKLGRIAYFRYDYADDEINKQTVHAGQPPADGETKWIASIWIHKEPFKPISN